MTFQIERKIKILEILENKKNIKINELCKLFNISRATALTDLKELASEEKVIKVHGGAILKYNKEIEKPIKNNIEIETNLDLKKKIGLHASQFVKDNDIIILSSGVTVLEMTKHLYNKKNLTIITNSITTAYYLFDNSTSSNLKIYLTGGLLRKRSGSMIGLLPLKALNEFNADKSFCGAAGIDTENITEIHPGEAEIARNMFLASKEKYALVDSTKFGKKHFINITSIKNIDVVITDKMVAKKYLAALKRNDTRLEVCK